MRVIFDTNFQSDFRQISRSYPLIKDEMRELIFAIEGLGRVPRGAGRPRNRPALQGPEAGRDWKVAAIANLRSLVERLER